MAVSKDARLEGLNENPVTGTFACAAGRGAGRALSPGVAGLAGDLVGPGKRDFEFWVEGSVEPGQAVEPGGQVLQLAGDDVDDDAFLLDLADHPTSRAPMTIGR